MTAEFMAFSTQETDYSALSDIERREKQGADKEFV